MKLGHEGGAVWLMHKPPKPGIVLPNGAIVIAARIRSKFPEDGFIVLCFYHGSYVSWNCGLDLSTAGGHYYPIEDFSPAVSDYFTR